MKFTKTQRRLSDWFDTYPDAKENWRTLSYRVIAQQAGVANMSARTNIPIVLAFKLGLTQAEVVAIRAEQKMHRNIRTDIDIKESAEELRKLMHTASFQDAATYRRLHLLYLLKTGFIKSATDGAMFFALHRQSVQNWINAYKKGGLTAMLERKQGYNPGALSPEQLGILQRKLDQKFFLRITDIQAFIKSEFQIEMSYSNVYAMVRRGKLRAEWIMKVKKKREAHKGV